MVLDAGDVSVTRYCTDKSLLRSCQDCRNWHSAAWLRDLEPFTRLHTRVWSGLDHSLHDQHQIENSPSWQLASAGFHLTTMTTTIVLDHATGSHPPENKSQILRIACTDRPFPGLEYRQNIICGHASGDAGQNLIHVRVLRRLATYFLTIRVLAPHLPWTARRVVSTKKSDSRAAWWTPDTSLQAKTILVADTSATSKAGPQPGVESPILHDSPSPT